MKIAASMLGAEWTEDFQEAPAPPRCQTEPGLLVLMRSMSLNVGSIEVQSFRKMSSVRSRTSNENPRTKNTLSHSKVPVPLGRADEALEHGKSK